MTTIRYDDLVESVAAALQYISYYHPADYIAHLARAYEREQSAAAKDAIAQILTNSKMSAIGHRPICQDTGIVNVFLKVGMGVRFEGFADHGVSEAIYLNDPDSNGVELYRDRPQVFTNRHIAETFQTQLRRTDDLPKSSRLHYGVEFLHDSIVSNNLGTHSRGRGSAYAAWDIRALNRFSFTLGVREEVSRNPQHSFTPSAGAGFWINRHVKLRASASRAAAAVNPSGADPSRANNSAAGLLQKSGCVIRPQSAA